MSIEGGNPLLGCRLDIRVRFGRGVRTGACRGQNGQHREPGEHPTDWVHPRANSDKNPPTCSLQTARCPWRRPRSTARHPSSKVTPAGAETGEISGAVTFVQTVQAAKDEHRNPLPTASAVTPVPGGRLMPRKGSVKSTSIIPGVLVGLYAVTILKTVTSTPPI